MKQFLIPHLMALVGVTVLCSDVAAKKNYPEHWGAPPRLQTNDYVDLPGGYGKGSSTLANWIKKNLAADAKKGIAAQDLKPLWNGNNLDDFEIKSGKATYKIQDGAIVGTTVAGSPNTFLCTKKLYGDFELHFEVKCDNELNSGVQIRSKIKTEGEKFGGRVNGPQVEIEASGKKGAEAGYLYGEAAGGWMTPEDQRKPHKHFKDGEWNHYRVIAKGARIQTWINGKKISDLTDEKKFKSHPKGLIGLQVHGVGNRGPFQVAWRNLKIKDL